jgi:hypothetical protein
MFVSVEKRKALIRKKFKKVLVLKSENIALLNIIQLTVHKKMLVKAHFSYKLYSLHWTA